MKSLIFILTFLLVSSCDNETKSNPPYCGDRIINQDLEECDGKDFENLTCESLDYYGGELSCHVDCSLNLTECKSHGICGDGVIQKAKGEECDTNNLDKKTCATLGFWRGDLSCDENCKFVEDNCVNPLDISTGIAHTCVVDEVGEIYCWGNGDLGQLGDGTGMYSIEDQDGTYFTIHEEFKPVRVVNDDNIIFSSVECGGSFTCALDTLNDVYCWGSNYFLGDASNLTFGDNDYTPHPNKVIFPQNIKIKKLSSGISHSCAVTEDGNVYCWGSNEFGQSGIINPVDISDNATPYYLSFPLLEATIIPNLNSVIDINAGFFTTCAITEDGSAYCWGLNEDGQTGQATPDNYCLDATHFLPPYTTFSCFSEPNRIPIVVPGTGGDERKFIEINPGGFAFGNDATSYFGHTCAITEYDNAKEVFCWGSNNYDQLGMWGDILYPSTYYLPRAVPFSYGVESYESLTTGLATNCIISTGVPWCWGFTGLGQIGVGPINEQSLATPRSVLKPLGVIFSKIHTSFLHTCGISEGKIWCWGLGTSGQLGLGSAEIVDLPYEVLPPKN
jgi:Regulator of chromosome condensation (RCC1) repeat